METPPTVLPTRLLPLLHRRAPSGARPVRAAGVVAAAVLAAGAAADGDRGAAARGDRRASNHHRGGSGGGRACVADATFCGVGRPLPSQRLAPAGVRGPVSFDATPVSQGLFCVRICLLVPSTRRLNLAARRRGSARRRGGAAWPGGAAARQRGAAARRNGAAARRRGAARRLCSACAGALVLPVTALDRGATRVRDASDG